jgi:hypothetical protein
MAGRVRSKLVVDNTRVAAEHNTQAAHNTTAEDNMVAGNKDKLDLC